MPVSSSRYDHRPEMAQLIFRVHDMANPLGAIQPSRLWLNRSRRPAFLASQVDEPPQMPRRTRPGTPGTRAHFNRSLRNVPYIEGFCCGESAVMATADADESIRHHLEVAQRRPYIVDPVAFAGILLATVGL